MLHFHHKLPTGGAVVLIAFLLHGCAVQAASLPRHYRLRGGEGEGQPAAFSPSSDMMKALEYIENLKQRNGGRPEPADYDEVEKFKVLLQLASQQDEVPEERPPAPAQQQRQDITAEQLMKALLRSLQDQADRDTKMSPASAPRNDRRTHRHRTKETEAPESAPADYGNFPRAHKKYPLMFEDEENADAAKRATEDLDEQYTPQSLANLRSIFEELGRMPSLGGQKRDVFGDEDEEEDEGVSLRNQAYEDVAGGEEWVPVEEREETEEMVNGSHEEMERELGEQEEAEREEMMQRRASQDQEETDDDTKLVDYYLLKVLEMTQKRDQTGEQRKRLIRPSIVDPRTVKELLELSLKLHVPPQDLIDMLLTQELRKLHQTPPHAPTRYTAGQTPKIRYFSRRLPLKSKPANEDMDREDFLDIIGVETISNEYPVVQRPMKTSSDRIQVAASPAVSSGPVKIPPPSGRRENLFLSELNKMPLKRQADRTADDESDDDGDIEDEVTTYLAAKILTEYPNPIAKRDTQAQLKGQFPYELYERALKDYLGQAEAEKRPVVKRETEVATEEKVNPTEMQGKEEVTAKTSAPQTINEAEEGGKEHREKNLAGM